MVACSGAWTRILSNTLVSDEGSANAIRPAAGRAIGRERREARLQIGRKRAPVDIAKRQRECRGEKQRVGGILGEVDHLDLAVIVAVRIDLQHGRDELELGEAQLMPDFRGSLIEHHDVGIVRARHARGKAGPGPEGELEALAGQVVG
ncbi:MAG TPA: hypothetical protein VGW40_01985 [Allosphingosinicella sp.]|nr:hypothetical protein [Allosphingosinicella sp.]